MYELLFSQSKADQRLSPRLIIHEMHNSITRINLSNPRVIDNLISQLRMIQAGTSEPTVIKSVIPDSKEDIVISTESLIESVSEEIEEIIKSIKKANYLSLCHADRVPAILNQISASLLILETRLDNIASPPLKSINVRRINSIADYLAFVNVFKIYFYSTVPSKINNELILQSEMVLNALYQHQVMQSNVELSNQVLATLSIVSELCDFIKNHSVPSRTRDFFKSIKQLHREFDRIFTLLSAVGRPSTDYGAN